MSIGKGSSFNLFGDEERVLADAEALGQRLADGPGEVKDGVAALVDAYRRSVREQRRLVKVSDRLQAQLGSVNQELARRKAEAEEALAKLQDAQEQLVQNEKLASLGALVGGVAHEINTPVGIALSCASHLADSTAHMRALFQADNIGVEDFERYIQTAADTSALILANCERAASLIRSFKQVAVDRASDERREFELAGYIRETLAALTPSLRQAGLTVEVDCPEDLRVDGYPGALSQILTNLVMNSVVHGYDGRGPGHIRIQVTEPQHGTIQLVFWDDGKGIPEEHRNRVFDPFFTTKRGAGGSGLGLHIVFNLVRGSLGGTVALDPSTAKGTAFVLTFPRVARPEGDGV